MKFTRSKPEIIKYLNKEIKSYRSYKDDKDPIFIKECDRAIYVLEHVKRFMKEKTDWIEFGRK